MKMIIFRKYRTAGFYVIVGFMFTCTPTILKSISLDSYDDGGNIIGELISNIGLLFYVVAGIIAGTTFIEKK